MTLPHPLGLKKSPLPTFTDKKPEPHRISSYPAALQTVLPSCPSLSLQHHRPARRDHHVATLEVLSDDNVNGRAVRQRG